MTCRMYFTEHKTYISVKRLFIKSIFFLTSTLAFNNLGKTKHKEVMWSACFCFRRILYLFLKISKVLQCFYYNEKNKRHLKSFRKISEKRNISGFGSFHALQKYMVTAITFSAAYERKKKRHEVPFFRCGRFQDWFFLSQRKLLTWNVCSRYPVPLETTGF